MPPHCAQVHLPSPPTAPLLGSPVPNLWASAPHTAHRSRLAPLLMAAAHTLHTWRGSGSCRSISSVTSSTSQPLQASSSTGLPGCMKGGLATQTCYRSCSRSDGSSTPVTVTVRPRGGTSRASLVRTGSAHSANLIGVCPVFNG